MSALVNLDYEERIFELEQRKAKAMISGSILPQRYKNIGDVIILNEMSRNLKIPTIMLAQQLYVVKGTPAMSGQLSIALANSSDRFDGVMRWEEENVGKPTWRIRAYNEINGELLYGNWLDDEMIKANGWGSNPKWQTMKQQMAQYRTASWFIRLYAPDVLLGFMEVEEVMDANIINTEPIYEKKDDLNSMLKPKPKKEKIVDAEIQDEEKDLLEDIEIDVSYETVNTKTGEVTQTKKPYKPNMSILDGVNADGTDIEIGE